jgi:flagellar M-ring protein FliF
MVEKLQKAFVQSWEFIQSLSPARRLSFVVIVVVTLLSFALIATYLAREDYQTLVSGLSNEDAQAISILLKDSNIPTRISNSGSEIHVPADKMDDARLELAAAGLPQSGGVGYEIFDKNDLGMTAFREQINLQRALEGELARTIRSLEEIRGARVHIVLPKKTLFKEDQKPPSASVVVDLQSGRQLNPRQIKGIRYLISSAIEGMEVNRVTILDGRGSVLARVGDSDEASSSVRMEHQQRIENRMEQNIRDLLEPLVGVGKVVAQVTVNLDFRKVVETRETYDPEKVVVRSEQRTMEKRTGSSKTAAGIAGARGNLPGSSGATTGRNGANSEKTSEVINYEVGHRRQQTEHPRGRIKKLSIAVVVDGDYKLQGQEDEAVKVYQPRSAEEMARLTNLVKKAIGYDETRGDQVEVSNVAFLVPEVVTSSMLTTLTDMNWVPILRVAGLIALALIVLFLFARPVINTITSSANPSVLAPGQSATVAELERRLLAGQSSDDAESEEASSLPPREFARQLAEENPARVVQVVRGWLDGAGNE